MKQKLLFVLSLLLLWSTQPTAAATDTSLDEYLGSGQKLFRLINVKYSAHALGIGTGTGIGTGEILKASTKDASDYAQIWIIQASGNGYTLQNAYTGRYASYATTNTTPFPTKTEPTVFYFKQVDDYYALGYSNSELTSYDFLHEQGDGVGVRWQGTSDASHWKLEAVTNVTEANITASSLDILNGASKGCFRFTSNASSLITDPSGVYAPSPAIQPQVVPATNDLDQIWQVRRNGNSNAFTLRNVKTGNYLERDFTSSNNFGRNIYTSEAPSSFFFLASVNSGKYTIQTLPGTTTRNALHHQTSGNLLVTWEAASSATTDVSSDWTFEQVTDLTDEQVRSSISSAMGYDSPTNGGYFRLYNKRAGNPMYENLQTHGLSCTEMVEEDFSQVWKLVKGTGNNANYYAIQNALTGGYVQGYSASSGYIVGKTAAYNFTFIDFTKDTDVCEFNIADKATSSTKGLNYNTSSNAIMSWGQFTTDEGSQWRVSAVTIDEDVLAAAQESYQDGQMSLENNDKYEVILRDFFSDYACTELKDAYRNMSDADLTAAMAATGLPNSLQKIAVKVKNRNWETYADGWNKTEETFRVATYKPYSDGGKWNKILMSKDVYHMGRLSNPTGITGKAGETIQLFVDAVPGTGATLAVESVNGTDPSGTLLELKQGLNTFICPEDGNLFIYYNVTAVEDASLSGEALIKAQPLLSDFAPIKIHIEGGHVNGYFDRTKGDTDDDWKNLQAHLLRESDILNMKTDNYVFCMKRDLVTAACPEKMAELMDIWNRIVVLQHDLMGIEAAEGRFNSIFNGYSMPVTSDYMHATNYGTFYNENTLFKVMNYEKMSTTGDIWGPAHETGHMNQMLLNMIGCTEVSNNIFSNVALYDQGYQTSNTSTPAALGDSIAKDVFWLDRGLYDRTRMYWQLYLYYHVMGHKPDFYPTLFKALREDPLKKTAYTTSNNAVNKASEDYLKFAQKCCEVAGEDLSEFFEAYGFFVIPSKTETISGQACYKVDDYSTYYISTFGLQTQIAIAKRNMKAYPRKSGNILFIDDRIEPVIGKNGQTKVKFYETGNTATTTINFAKHEYGEMGHYTDFTDDAANTAAFNYSVDDNGNVKVAGDGAVGFKVYAADGSLAYIANTSAFTLPATVGSNYTIVAALANGSDIEAKKTDKLYSLKVYEGNEIGTSKYSTGTDDLPLLSGNAVAVVQETGAPASLTSATNIINKKEKITYEAANIVLSDTEDYYAPVKFTAHELSYTRTATAGCNSVCLPFALAASDLAAGSAIGSPDKILTEDGETTIHFSTVAATDAGKPCIVYNPQGTTAWNITKSDVPMVGTPGKVAVTSAFTLRGSFANTSISTGLYLPNADYTLLNVTTAEEPIVAFRIYAEGKNLGERIHVDFDKDTNTSISNLPATAPAETIYDLSGRRVVSPVKGGIYIVNGKKVIR